MTNATRSWWRDALVYQTYVRSFLDSDADGVGDLEGIRSKLPYLASLAVDALWLNPCYPSPQRDHGYDVSDYFDIHHEYGTLATFDRLVADAHGHGIRIVMDIVPNHCSNEHPWFEAAVAAGPGSAERARFYFRDGNGGGPPNNWRAAFGGSAWTRVNDDPSDGQWYLGTFTPHQPDFDHTNPDVQALFAKVLGFWFDRGVDGFRVDAVSPVGKHPDLPDQPPVDPDLGELDIPWENPYTVFRPEGHDVWRRWRAFVDDYSSSHPEREVMMIGEAYITRRPDLLERFTGPDQFHQMFAFDLMLSPWDRDSLSRAIRDVLDVLGPRDHAPAWTLNNHDINRIVTRLGSSVATDPEAWTNNNLVAFRGDVDLAVGERRARAAIAIASALPGSLYLYQGEELALPEVIDIPAERREDPLFFLTDGAEPGRDGCRVPLPWTDDSATSFGFSPGRSGSCGAPWLPQPEWWGTYAVSVADGQPGSTLAMYRELARLRREHALGQGDEITMCDVGPGLLAFVRGDLLVVANVTDEPIAVHLDEPPLAGRRPVFSSSPSEMHTPGVIPADSTVWFVN